MANKTILLGDNDIAKLTNISGNVDLDKLVPFIYMAQQNKIKQMLGIPLYNKIMADYDADTLSGDYKTLYEDYIVDALVYFTAYFYWSVGHYQLDNNGAYRKTVENAETIDGDELIRAAKFFEQQGQVVVMGFEEYVKTVTFPEYPNGCVGGSSRGLNWYI